MASDAVGSERVSRVVGYKIASGDFSTTTPNLPQRIAIIGEGNTAQQGTMPTTPTVVSSAKQAGELYGFGSPIHMAMRILRPNFSDGVGGIPTVVYGQLAAGGATSKKYTVTVTGTATSNKTHNVIIAGRDNLDGESYAINIVTGDTPTLVAAKISDVLNSVLGCPFIGTSALGVTTAESKWTGLTAEDLKISIDTNGDVAGLTYVVASTQAGSATPTVTASLTLFDTNWNTIVVNTYGTVSATMDELEAYNGIPDPTTPTGRFAGTVMKPFVALTGSVIADPSSITNARLNDVTIAICPAPLSSAHPLEAAANVAVLEARNAQDTPHLDISARVMTDMPGPYGSDAIGVMSDYNERDRIVKLGCSTVDFINGQYRIQDFVTTFHPLGDLTPQFRYVRSLMIDVNIRFGYFLLEEINVVDHAIVSDSEIVEVGGIIKPKQWKAILNKYADDLVRKALITDADFFKSSLVVNISNVNPDRLETYFKYKRTGVVRIAATTAEAGFNFGV